jgi:LPS sulfotransferase NodH
MRKSTDMSPNVRSSKGRGPLKHVIITSGRSGSNYLTDVINGHPALTNYGEVFGDYMVPYRWHRRFQYGGAALDEYLDFTLSSRRHFEMAKLYSIARRTQQRKPLRPKKWKNLESIGVKEFSPRLMTLGLDRYLSERPEIKVIHLHREDVLARAISVLHLQESKTVAVTSDRGTTRRIYLPAKSVVDMVRTIEREMGEQHQLVDAIAPERVLDVAYAELFASSTSHDRIIASLFDFLQVDRMLTVSAHRKILPTTMWETLTNSEEVAEVLTMAGLAQHLPPRPAIRNSAA